METTKINGMSYGINLSGFNCAMASDAEINDLKSLIYTNALVILKNQSLSPNEYVEFGKKLGRVEKYYEEMYHHPENSDIFVSSNIEKDGKNQGVPKTGSFWHSDYAFMPQPFAFSIIYPQVIPQKNRGTYFIDMAKAYDSLGESLQKAIANGYGIHSVRKFFKIRPWDVYRPIGEIIKEIETRTPPVKHPLVVTHPITGRKILYLSQGFTISTHTQVSESKDDNLLDILLEHSGQLDTTFANPLIELFKVEKDDIVMWDNRRLIHHAKHSGISEPACSYRLTVYDEYPFSKQ